MKIFFTTSPRTKLAYPKEIEAIYNVLHSQKDFHLTEKFIEQISVEDFYGWSSEKKQNYFIQTKRAISNSDVCIFEASLSSIGVGYLVNYASKLEKPSIILHRASKEPFMLSDQSSEKIITTEYSLHNIQNELIQSIDYAKGFINSRFNFVIDSDSNNYLIWASKRLNMPKSEIIRTLIKEKMKSDKNYSDK